MERLLANWYLYIYNSMFTQSKTYDTLTTYSDAIMDTIGPDGPMHSAYLVMRTIAFGILTVYFIITFGSRMEGRENSPAMVFKTLLEYFIGYALALFSFDIVRWLFIFGDWMASLIVESVESTDTALNLVSLTDTFAASISGLGFTAQVMYAFKALIPYILNIGANIIITYTIVSRVIRICVSAAMSPIAISNFFDDSRRADGMRFIKKTLSMCLQCSAIMIISAATTSLSTYMASNSIYADSLQEGSQIADARQAMIDSASIDYGTVSEDVAYAIDKLGYSAYTDTWVLKEKYVTARDALVSNISEVTEEKEDEYKKYEKTLKIRIFNRTEDGNHYTYDSKGNALLLPEYMTFTAETVKDFMDAILSGDNWLIYIMLIAIKVGLIKQSNSLCNVIVGL